MGPDPKMIPKRSPELNLGISKGSPSVNPPSTIRFIQRAANGDPLSVSCPFGVGMGFPRRLQIRRFGLHGGSKQNRAQAGNCLAVAKRIGRKHPQHETPKLHTPELLGKIQIHPTSFFAEQEANIPKTTRGKERFCVTHHGQRRKT